MYDTKYVIVDGSAIVFSSAIMHSDMVKNYQKAESAGFVKFYINKNEDGEEMIKAKCYGNSFSLGIESREEDSMIVTRQICGRDNF